MTACFCHWPVGYEWETDIELIDHRYFYELDGLGYYTCGLVRNAVAEKLFELGVDFADTDFLASLPDFFDNPSVRGSDRNGLV